MVYALVVMFADSGPGDERQAAEWIHKADRFSQRSQRPQPAAGVVGPLERMLQAPDAVLPAWEPLLENEDPWVRHWPGCSSARCGSCSATAGGKRTRTSRWRSPSSGRSANGSGFRSP